MKRLLRRIVHTVAHRLVVRPSHARTVHTRASGFELTVGPTVFHPRWFLSSEIFARFIGHLDLVGKRVADVGTGSGILALAAARAGASLVAAVDINPEAARSAMANVNANGFANRVSVLNGDLLSALSPDARFDTIVSNPPFFPGEPVDLADRAWHAGPDYRDLRPLFDQARERLAPEGTLYLMLSSDADLETLHTLFEEAGFDHRIAYTRGFFLEAMHIYELRPRSENSPSPTI